MCCHSRVIYSVCGHSCFGRRPIVECRNASIDPMLEYSTTCEIYGHPFKSLRLDQLCPGCQRRREVLLQEIDASHVVKFDEWQWKVSYGLPGHGGKDYWTRKAEEREEEHEKKDSGRRKSQKRFSWRRSRRKTKVPGVDSPLTPRTPRIPEE
ncbi:hypothetical protein CLAFUW4_00577 [Fulvia fulva]|uniref:Uncharacterized protein n=1 Tax=Passalora fulva TaxID=5499 RepID=A0A9Q8L5S6_PASFU|nr:uncharacterized protein CLAFUR5_00576 [Fulvia fulva]KAK4635131.1 hypothetical protein CLAFUR4_00578 [Fulvia fulva]KAK4636352.1 hypothetical protein CLAFUR0_00579 [Fulvia fulva]UJO11259.1 hypothetical protein CLAFUR5_00576 [Fulvia fulva]WPV09730.1 hypothetical protein CLAFUW4_00577 [Fulvia fulva]WPV24603.1 hypothetical protein CLAFUW7_00582 [Fulvia fulva]